MQSRIFYFISFFVGILILSSCGSTQKMSDTTMSSKEKYAVSCIGFYNLENLFDTLDTDNVRDSEFTPNGSKRYNSKMYYDKLERLSSVISMMGTDLTPDGPAILGVSEIENKSVLVDLVKQKKIASRDYQIIHHQSTDERGIDVALLYQAKYFKPSNVKAFPLLLYRENGSRNYTRDVLLVSGVFNGENVHILINHWPSRSGGEMASRPSRNKAADINRMIVDSLNNAENGAKIFVLGDLNDHPTNKSVMEHLKAKSNKNDVGIMDLYNPTHQFYVKGNGTTAWRDTWGLFDQIIVSGKLLHQHADGMKFYKFSIFKKPFMLNKTGQYKGYPKRCFVGDNYQYGYSDHFPVVTYLIKKVGE